MALVSIRDASVGYGRPHLLQHVNLQIEEGERIALMGRNGTGKTTLLKLINHDLVQEAGVVTFRSGLRSALVAQQVPDHLTGDVRALVRDGYLASRMPGDQLHLAVLPSQASLDRIVSDEALPISPLVQDEAWQEEIALQRVLQQTGLQADADFRELSAGLKRRVLFARALIFNPNLLLLDEPTNHLDIESIRWLEELLLGYRGACVVVSHDRAFIRAIASRVIELDRRTLLAWNCDYETYLKRREQALEIEDHQWVVQSRTMAEEEAWIHRGVKARRKRNQGRVRALQQMRQTRRERFERTGSVRMLAQESERSGDLVLAAEKLSFSYDERPIIKSLSTVISRRDKIGIIGPNGCGKTTLLKLLLGQLRPSSGELRYGTKLQTAYFDQLRHQLADDKSVADNVANGADVITINGKPRQVLAHLMDFLFTPERARHPVKILSGGERNRLLLAKLFTQPFNLLVMDEPTNDLDAETLELLEELLMGYDGTVLVVSHDREFLNNIVTSILAFEGDGVVTDYVGGYDDWLRQRSQAATSAVKERPELPQRVKDRHRKLSYAQKQELDSLPDRIEELEDEQRQMFALMGEPGFFHRDRKAAIEAKQRLEDLTLELHDAYDRWEELETLRQEIETEREDQQ